MNMRKIQYILSGITLITLPLGIHAQQQAKDSTVNRTVVVEQEYYPRYSGCVQNKRAPPSGSADCQ